MTHSLSTAQMAELVKIISEDNVSVYRNIVLELAAQFPLILLECGGESNSLFEAEICDMIQRKGMVTAIKHYRSARSVDLKTAKHSVDEIKARYGIKSKGELEREAYEY